MDNSIDWSLFSEVEKLKYDSDYLRGTLEQSLVDPVTGAIAARDTQISKFHGIYQQFDRDTEKERKRQKLEPAFSYLIRIRLPGGVTSKEQWLKLDSLADTYANGTLKLTTRQAFQFHGVFKQNLKKTIQGINDALLDTIAACGDVNRNVMVNANAEESGIHKQLVQLANNLSEHLKPASKAYHEIWLEKKKIASSEKEFEPIYGKTYLPRKFKISVALPPYNDTDIFSQDLGFIAIVENDKIVGYNVTAGGGMGSTFAIPEAYPRLADVIGFCLPEQVIDVAEKIVLIQKKNGDRKNRKQARLKYTIDRLGLEWFKNELNKQLGYFLQPERPFKFTYNGDRFGWVKGENNKWSLTLFVEGGRVKDVDGQLLKTALREVAEKTDAQFILTGNQNLIIANTTKKTVVNAILKKYNIGQNKLSGLRKNSLACVALNTCGLAFAEAERYLPKLIDKLDVIFKSNGLEEKEVVIRMTGCPNGCGRPYLAEIGFVGKSLGYYNLYLGGNFNGTRLNTLYRETITEGEIIKELTPIIEDYAKNRIKNEGFGDFTIRKKYVKAILKGSDFRH